jgi:streptogrisin C
MKRRSVARVAGAVLLATITTVPAAALANAEADPVTRPDGVSADVLTAMKRDLGLDADQALDRLQKQNAASLAQHVAKGAAGDAFAGAWFDAASSRLVVGLTDAAKADAVKSLGVDTRVVSHTERTLTETKARLDASDAPASVTGWYVDTKNNTVVVRAARGAAAEAEGFAASAGGPVEVVETDSAPRLLGNIVGGDAYYIGGGRCSVGFAVSGGFVSAGHCGSVGASVESGAGGDSGTFEGSEFPGDDYSFIAADSGWTPTPVVNGYGTVGDVTVTGSSEAAVGASVCRSGSTTGWHCGEILSKDETVRYPEGSVSGLTRTDACAEPGDSGGSWVSGDQAQGVTSGGSGDCTSGGETYFQPVNEILSAYGLSLTTG